LLHQMLARCSVLGLSLVFAGGTLAQDRLGCPHRAAEQLSRSYDDIISSRSDVAADVEGAGSDWAYVNISTKLVPALIDDGVHIDPYNKVATPMIVYPSKRQN